MGCKMGNIILTEVESNNIIAFWALIVSMVSLVVTIGVTIVTIIIQKKINTMNLEANYYDYIFKKFILEEIPQKFSVLKFDANKQLNKNYKELNKTMMNMVRKARYFRFSNPNFYKKLSDMTMELDEKLVTLSGKKIDIISDQNKKLIEIEDYLSKIILLINKNYCKRLK